jgi:hypothetical protein
MVETADLATAAGWAEARSVAFHPALLPRLGVVAEMGDSPEAMLWLRMDNSVGVCWLECAMAKPGLALRRLKAAFSLLVDCLLQEATRLDYHFAIVHTRPGIARFMQSLGFVRDPVPYVKLTKLF